MHNLMAAFHGGEDLIPLALHFRAISVHGMAQTGVVKDALTGCDVLGN
jgi:hypothetical protein